jgi:mycothiol synthase
MELTDPQTGGLTTRPLTYGDEAAVTSVIAAQELADVGEVVIELADIVGDWQRPSFAVEASTIGVFDGHRLVAYAELSGADRSDAAVDPDYRGRGVGTALAGWIRDTARRRGAQVVGMPVPEGSAGDRLLAALGYRVRWTSWVLELPPGTAIAERPLPAGYAVRAADPTEYAAVHDVIEDAFLEWSVRPRERYDDFAASVLQRPGFEPWNLRVVTDPAGAVVGTLVVQMAGDDLDEGFIARLAVRRDERGRGLAQILLLDGFGQARSHGATRSTLSTDSRTGALSLYEKVGMVVTSTWVNRAIDL